jgi:hypothetical protein
VSKFDTFTLATFIKWNPAVGSVCSSLFLNYYYCIGIPGTPTKKPTPTSRKPSATPKPTCNPSAPTPTPTQPGAICGCKKWHKVVSGNTCDTIVKQYGITKANFNKWNPKVGSACQTLWLGYSVCVGK